MVMAGALNLPMLRVPPLFRCPISLELMKDPVTLCTGQTYDRSSIEKWFEEGHSTCPATMQIVGPTHDLIPNHTLRRLIQEWCVLNRSKGIERIPTPKQPVEPEQARQMLCQISEGEDSKRRSRALRSLRSVAKESEKNRRRFAEAGAVRVLSKAVSSFELNEEKSSLEDLEACEDALAILSMLPCCEDDTVKKSILSPSLLAVLSWVLNRASCEGKINAAFLLESLAIDDDAKSQMGATQGLIPGLVKLLSEDLYQRAVKSSLTALLSIVSCKKNRVKAVESGAVAPLIELLPDATRSNAERALGVLEFLARCAEGRAALIHHKLCVPMLVRIILTVSDVATERAVGILWVMCQADLSVVQAAAEEGAFTQMLLLIQADNSLCTHQRARELLKLLRSGMSQDCFQDFAFTMPF